MKLPSLCVHRASGLYYVKIQGKRHYLGRDRLKAEAERLRLLAEHQAGALTTPTDHLTVGELLDRYREHARKYYPPKERDNIRLAVRHLAQLYGHTLAADFSPRALETVRQAMIDAQLCRTRINRDINRVRMVFRWGVERELVPATVYQALRAVANLRAGRSAAVESEPVRPVPVEVVERTADAAGPVVGTMIRLQLLTGMRPGEVCRLRPMDVDRTQPIWTYRPGSDAGTNGSHKTAHLGHSRVILLGPQAQSLLAPFLDREPSRYCFAPGESMVFHRQKRREGRKTPVYPCERKKSVRKQLTFVKKMQGYYKPPAYSNAVAAACRRAKAPHWHPHQLRHTAATRLRAMFGPDIARAVLGQRSLAATQIYAELDLDGAARAIEQIG